jgi:hypothetical protein
VAHAIGTPEHALTPVYQSQPDRAEQAAWVVWRPQACGVPLQAVDSQMQLYSASQAVDVVLALHGVIVPVHELVPDQLQ